MEIARHDSDAEVRALAISKLTPDEAFFFRKPDLIRKCRDVIAGRQTAEIALEFGSQEELADLAIGHADFAVRSRAIEKVLDEDTRVQFALDLRNKAPGEQDIDPDYDTSYEFWQWWKNFLAKVSDRNKLTIVFGRPRLASMIVDQLEATALEDIVKRSRDREVRELAERILAKGRAT